MSDPISLRVITPEAIARDTTCTSISFPTTDGSVGVLKDHAPMVAALGVGELAIRSSDGTNDAMFIAGGFAEVRDNVARIVTDVSEAPSDIDVDRAVKAAERARARLDTQESVEGEHLDVLRARGALARAIMRQQIATKYRR